MNKLNDIQRLELEMLKEIERIARKHKITYYLAYGSALGAVRHKGFIPWDSDVDIVVKIHDYYNLCKAISKDIDSKFKLSSIDTEENYDSLKARVSMEGLSHHKLHVDIFPLVGSPKANITKYFFSNLCYIIYRLYFVKKLDSNQLYMDQSKKRIIAKVAKVLTFPIPNKLILYIFNKLSKLYPIEKSKELYNICGSYGMKEFIPKNYYSEPVYQTFEDGKFPIPREWDSYLTHIYGDYMVPKKSNYV